MEPNNATMAAEPTSGRYLELSRTFNQIAGEALRLQRKPRPKSIENARAKVATGLSMQAAELAGKAVLRALGLTLEEIRNVHRGHNLLELYRDVEKRVLEQPALKAFHHFMLRTPFVDGQQFSSTTRKYFEDHFAQGSYAHPRNYFYPDQEKWTGSDPVQAFYFIVEDLIRSAEGMTQALEQESRLIR